MTFDVRLGFVSGLAAYLSWGFLPLYFRFLGHISPDLMLAQRITWSVPTGMLFVAIAWSSAQVRAALTPRRLGWLGLSALLIAINWMTYIWAVDQERVLEASLGYYINPIMNVIIGAIFLGERLTRLQWTAVGLAGLGVCIVTSAFGSIPWVALILCISFAFYSLIRKQVEVDARAGFLVEATILLPVALFWIVHLEEAGGAIFGRGGWDIVWLALSGPITAVPLICFAIAAKRLRLSTIGMMQYIGPTIQFLIAIALGEAFGSAHGLAFGLIWLALILFSWDGLRAARRDIRQPA